MSTLFNDPNYSAPTVEVHILRDRHGSCDLVYLTAREIRRYNRDPDGFAAKRLGYKTTEDYYRAVAHLGVEPTIWRAYCSVRPKVRAKALAELAAQG
jgi:hypothetical protein